MLTNYCVQTVMFIINTDVKFSYDPAARSKMKQQQATRYVWRLEEVVGCTTSDDGLTATRSWIKLWTDDIQHMQT